MRLVGRPNCESRRGGKKKERRGRTSKVTEEPTGLFPWSAGGGGKREESKREEGKAIKRNRTRHGQESRGWRNGCLSLSLTRHDDLTAQLVLFSLVDLKCPRFWLGRSLSCYCAGPFELIRNDLIDFDRFLAPERSTWYTIGSHSLNRK